MFGKINFVDFTELNLDYIPVDAKTAWETATKPAVVGAPIYTPIEYCGNQVVSGVNHFFIAEQRVTINPPVRRLVLVVINNGKIVHVQEILS